VIDPTKVTRIALENAASIASLLLTTEAMITDKPGEEIADARRYAWWRHGWRHGRRLRRLLDLPILRTRGLPPASTDTPAAGNPPRGFPYIPQGDFDSPQTDQSPNFSPNLPADDL